MRESDLLVRDYTAIGLKELYFRVTPLPSHNLVRRNRLH